nr:hypothetical protein P5627_13770 [Bacillus safensis]
MIRLSYYSIQKGKTAEWVLGALIEAADRGVKVQLLLDGICHSLRGPLKDLRYAVANHPNMVPFVFMSLFGYLSHGRGITAFMISFCW